MTSAAPLERVALRGLAWDRIADAFNHCYDGYVVPIRMAGDDMRPRFAAEDIDLAASHLILAGGEPAALGFVARRGERSRLAAFGVAPRWRGKGIAGNLLADILEQANRRGDAAMELEVFGHNPAAVKLYQRHGFLAVDRLLGFEMVANAGVPGSAPLRQAAELPGNGDAGLPWQLQAATLNRLPRPWQIVHDGEGAFAMVDLSKEAAVQLRFLEVEPEFRGKGRARRLIAAIRQEAPARPIRAAQLVPSAFENFMQLLGFGTAEHFQWRMVRRFRGG